MSELNPKYSEKTTAGARKRKKRDKMNTSKMSFFFVCLGLLHKLLVQFIIISIQVLSAFKTPFFVFSLTTGFTNEQILSLNDAFKALKAADDGASGSISHSSHDQTTASDQYLG